MRGTLKAYCLAVAAAISFPAIGGQTLYDYMSDIAAGTTTSGAAFLEGTEKFDSYGSTYMLNVDVDYAVFSPGYYDVGLVDRVSDDYWLDGATLSPQDYLYVYRIRNIGNTDTQSQLFSAVVSSLVMHRYPDIDDADYKLGYGSIDGSGDIAPSSVDLSNGPAGGPLRFNFRESEGGSPVIAGSSSTLLLVASPYSFDWPENWYPASVLNGGLSDQGNMPVPFPGLGPGDVQTVAAPGAFLLGGMGAVLAGIIKKFGYFL